MSTAPSIRPKRGLRFDRVALAVMAGVQRELRDDVPANMTLFFTLTAPIHVPAKSTSDIIERARRWLGRHAAPASARWDVHGNTVRIRLVAGRSPTSPNVAGFVHNPDFDTKALLDEAEAMLRG